MHFEDKETVKAMSKGGYFGFCGVVVHFRKWQVVVDILWLVVRGGGHILASGGWWWVVVDIFWMVVGGGRWWWVMVGVDIV